jgi:hypothetical protein
VGNGAVNRRVTEGADRGKGCSGCTRVVRPGSRKGRRRPRAWRCSRWAGYRPRWLPSSRASSPWGSGPSPRPVSTRCGSSRGWVHLLDQKLPVRVPRVEPRGPPRHVRRLPGAPGGGYRPLPPDPPRAELWAVPRDRRGGPGGLRALALDRVPTLHPGAVRRPAPRWEDLRRVYPGRRARDHGHGGEALPGGSSRPGPRTPRPARRSFGSSSSGASATSKASCASSTAPSACGRP